MRRNHLIDFARAFSVLVVVAFHAILFRAALVDGHLVVTPWAAPTWFYPFTWVFMIMPLFFVAGGYGNAASLSRGGAGAAGPGATDSGLAGSGGANSGVGDSITTGTSAVDSGVTEPGAGDSSVADSGTADKFRWDNYLARRGRRLVSPLANFVTAVAVVFSLAAWLGWAEPAIRLSAQLAQLLWFMAVYLVITLIAPVLVRAHDKYGSGVIIGLGLAAAAVDWASFSSGNVELRNLNMLLVWPLCHQLGIAYQRGWLVTGSWRHVFSAFGFGLTTIGILVFLAGYPPTAVGFADLPIANVQPPTLAMAALAIAQCSVLALLQRLGVGQQVSAGTRKRLDLLSGLLVTIYLWHIPAIFIAGGGLLALAWCWPSAAYIWLSPVLVSLASIAVVTLITPGIAAIDYLFIPKATGRPQSGRVYLAYALLLIATVLVWRYGAVLHPDSVASTIGVLGLWLGTWLMRTSVR